MYPNNYNYYPSYRDFLKLVKGKTKRNGVFYQDGIPAPKPKPKRFKANLSIEGEKK
jgi:hypothetical protein